MLNCDDIAITEELIRQLVASAGKPSYQFGLSGSNPANSWLDAAGKPSNKTGIPFGLNNGKLIEVWVGNELLAAYEIKIYYHYGDETGLTLLKTLNVPNAARTKTFTITDIGDVSVPSNCQIAVRVGSITGTPNPMNVGVHATILGSR